MEWTEEEKWEFLRSSRSAETSTAPPPQTKTAIPKSIFNPQTYDEYIGQDKAKELLTIAVTAARREKRPLPNILLIGGYGLGKTSLAQITLREFKGSVYTQDMMDGMAVNKLRPDKGTYIFDEIHLLDPAVTDKLNVFLDMGTLHVIGCTTDPGKLPPAFKSRFRVIQLNPYTVAEIETIAARVCARRGTRHRPGVLAYVAQRCRFNARLVTVYLSMIFDLMAVNRNREIDFDNAMRCFELLGVDDEGLWERDRNYLAAMPARPIGLSALSAVLGIDPVTIENEIEPYLLQQGYIDRTPKGRVRLK